MRPHPVLLRSCHGKLNLFLDVLGKRTDGYHDIETVMVPAPVKDEVTAALDPSGEVSLELRFPGGRVDPSVPAGDANLVVRAARLVLREAGSAAGVRLSLLKRIPVGAGLGGGSSDAACTLDLVNELLGGPVAPARLAALALELGSDVPYFLLHGCAALARGRGEELQSVPMAPGLRFELLFPGFPLSTRAVYERCRPPSPAKRRSAHSVLNALGKGDAEALSRACFNRLEVPAREVEPRLGAALDRWRAEGRGPVHMTGSGSCCFRVAGVGTI